MTEIPSDRVDPALAAGNRRTLAEYRATHFGWSVAAGVATVTLDRPERKNPLTFASYAELRDLFGQLRQATDVHAVVLVGSGGNFCLRRRRARDHRPADSTACARTPDVHPHDRRPGQGHARLPATHRGGAGRHLRRRRRHPRDGLRPAPGHRAQQDRVPLQPRRPGGLRHGRLRDAAASDRAGQGERTPLYRPRPRWRGSRTLGFPEPTGGAGRLARPRRRRWHARSPPGRRSPTGSPRPCCTRNGP